MKNALAIVALAPCLSIAAHADGAPQVPEGFVTCSKIQDAAERVRCYDAQVAAMKKAAEGAAPSSSAAPAAPPVDASASSAAPSSNAAPAAASSPAPANAGSAAPSSSRTVPARAATPRESATARFGEEDLPPSLQPKRTPEEMSLSSSITGVANGTAGVYYFSLANGQVWRADGAELALSPLIPVVFRVGVPIRIERGSLGSYHMFAPAVGAKNWMYVKRVR